MLDESTTEKRFEAAAECLDKRRAFFAMRVRAASTGATEWTDDRDSDDVAQVIRNYPLWTRGELFPLGPVSTIKGELQADSESAGTLALASFQRLDLTFEFLAICPAWNRVFDEAERCVAAGRLIRLFSLANPDGAAPSASEDLCRSVDWILENIARLESDDGLPKSRDLDSWHSWSDRREQSWCDSVADTAREFAAIGQIPTSLLQCGHYFDCPRCQSAFPELERHLRRFETFTIDQCHELLKVLGVCVNRVFRETEEGSRCPDEIIWRAIVCGHGLGHNDSIREGVRVALEFSSEDLPSSALQRLRSSFDEDELYLLSFVDADVFIELQWSLYDYDEIVHLPSDGDLWDIPKVVSVVKEHDLKNWRRLMTDSDVISEQSPLRGNALFRLAHEVASLRRHRQAARALPNGEPAPALTLSSGDASSVHDKLDSIAAAQIPMMDTMQSLAASIDRPSRIRAEETFRQAVGEETYRDLPPRAREFAVIAEYYWLDANSPAPGDIVLNLAKAFESCLKEKLFSPFADGLIYRKFRQYPGHACIPAIPGYGAQPEHPSSGQLLPELSAAPPLLRNGKMSTRFTLGDMENWLETAQPPLPEFLAQRRIDRAALLRVLPEIKKARNRVAHPGEMLGHAEAAEIRRRWLGKTPDFPNIFTLFLTSGLTNSAAGD